MTVTTTCCTPQFSLVLGVSWVVWLLTKQYIHCQAFRSSVLHMLPYPFLPGNARLSSYMCDITQRLSTRIVNV
ncbi:uncharacterized protein EDB93DRAFT_1137289 [Suillus bovinus]|uniref:uncharacterized protein n=1 Tax=Suillus bovinus TaxID=48563 RepID=UPI001B85C92A|nr:uncharacterized protein EDB93DRAFT_1137289 [Suillus bovinus]KAG2152573.1 hypothetical protein EDB93DRAFT_1137289 [Suillus bovinus]